MLLGIFGALTAGILAAAYLHYRTYEQHFRAAVERQLSSIADLKTGELEQWRKERLEDARILFKNPSLTALVRRFVENPGDADAGSQLRLWLGKMQVGHDFDAVHLLDPQGVARLSSPAGIATPAESQVEVVRDCLHSGQVAFLDFYRNELDGRVYLGICVPVLDEREADRPLGAIFLRTDPETYLYPFIKRWPTESATAETLLLRREGNEVVYLNDLRHRSSTLLSVRVAMDQSEVPAVQAARGRSGTIQGVDYRGEPVLAASRAVRDSPWFVVAKIDVEEVEAPRHERLWQLAALVGALLVSSGSCVGFVWRQQHVRHYRERARVAEEARRSEQRFRTYFELPLIGIAITSPSKGWLEVNDELCTILGYSRDQLEGMTWAELTHPEDLGADAAQFGRVLAGELEGYSMEKRFIRGDGSILHSELAVRCVRTPEGKADYFVALVKDINERRRAMEAVRLSAAALAEKNAEMERFLYAASHDLKSPVVTIQTFLGYLEQDVANADVGRMHKDLGFIRSAADKIARLLDELLEVSRVGRSTNPPERVTFRGLVDEALVAVAGRIADRGVAVSVGDHNLTLHGDAIRLAEIWQNLVENACKFMGDQKEPRIWIGVESRGTETIFHVRDNGIGLDPRHQAKVFELFEKLDPNAEGTGLGLALVKRIVGLYHGRIWVESEGRGRGACFRFTLPDAVTGDAGTVVKP